MATQKRKSHVKKPHIRTAHYNSYWSYVRDLNGDIIYGADGKPIKVKTKKWLSDISIHADGAVQLPLISETTNDTPAEEIKPTEKIEPKEAKKEEKNMPNTYTNPNGRSIRRGEIYYVKKSPVVGSEQEAGRPALIVSNNVFNATSQTVVLVYLTTQPKKPMKEHIPCVATGVASTILCEQICTASIERVGDYVTTLTPQEMDQVDVALMYSIALDKYIKTDETIDGYVEKVEPAPAPAPVPAPVLAPSKEDEYKSEISALKTAKKLAEEMADKATSELMELRQQIITLTTERDMYKNVYNDILGRALK